jgi:hypothetical protein
MPDCDAQDGDMTLFANVHNKHIFPHTMQYDVVAPTERCAQMVLWNSAGALDSGRCQS